MRTAKSGRHLSHVSLSFVLLCVLLAVLWWLYASVRVWRFDASQSVVLARFGSAAIGLILAASVVDYPARTPLIMAVTTVAAFLLALGVKQGSPARTRAV